MQVNHGHATLSGYHTPGTAFVGTGTRTDAAGTLIPWDPANPPRLHIEGVADPLLATVSSDGTTANAVATWAAADDQTTSWPAADLSAWVDVTAGGYTTVVAGGRLAHQSRTSGVRQCQTLFGATVHVDLHVGGEAHATSHASGGSDPVTPAAIGASPAVHTHTSAAITDLTEAVQDAAAALVADAIGNADNLLTGTVADARLPVTAQAATLAATFGGLPAAYIDPRTMADGAVTTLSRGTLVASYGNSPAVVASGQIAHTPTAGANTAAYIETLLSGPARRIGAVIDWGATANGTAAVVIPAASWAAGIGNAGVHCTVTAAGVVSCGRYISPGGLVGTQTTNVGALTGRHALEVGIDSILQQITVWLDGVRVLRYTDATAFTYLSNRAIWELYEPNGTSNVPCVLRSTWADVERVIPTAIPFDDVQPIRKSYASNNSSAASITVTTTYRAVIGIGTLSVYFPPSGRLLCRYRVMLSANGLTNTKRVYGSIASAADQALCYGGYVGPVTCEMVVTGTPGALQVLSPQMWAEDASGTVTATISGTTGVAMMSAIPVEAIVA